jgi:hypothetical protein
MTTKVIYFTAGALPTGGELTEINAIAAIAGIALSIRNGHVSALYGDGDTNYEEADFVAGTPPTGTDYDDTNVYPLYVAGDHVTPSLVDEGDTIVLTDAAGVTLNCTLVVTAGVPTLTCPSTAAILKSGIEKLSADKSGVYTNGFTPTIVNGAITVLAGS